MLILFTVAVPKKSQFIFGNILGEPRDGNIKLQMLLLEKRMESV